ncbi:unnamed protein product [Cylindrotheca closterium]|uniref:Uncharacterized protein n=1 Tax=Cylindrotheca closterium TaxID=2856 RepID=A0AAD2FGD0_9STRA|nr:unnamed protein product [Cylindrotheca closterium]
MADGRPTMADGRPTLQKKLTLRDLNVEAESDAESISVVNNGPLLRESNDISIRSDSDHGDQDEHDEHDALGTSAHDKLLATLATLGISQDIDTSGMEEYHRRLSDVTFSDKSYIMDLGRQQASREETIRKEAFEDSHIWYEKALAKGMPESKELFASIFSQVTEEVRERYVEYHKKQDEWLDQALDDYQKKLSAEQLKKIQGAAPTDDDVKKQKLAKKISKTEKLMKRASKNEGKDSETYLNYAKKLAEYQTKSDELEVPKARNSNGGTTKKSKGNKKDRKSSKSSKQLDDDDDRSKKSKRSTKTNGTKKLKKKKDTKEKKKGGRSGSSLRVSASADDETKKSSSSKVLGKKKKAAKPERQASLPS